MLCRKSLQKVWDYKIIVTHLGNPDSMQCFLAFKNDIYEETLLQKINIVNLHIYSKPTGPEHSLPAFVSTTRVKHLLGSDRACIHACMCGGGAQLSQLPPMVATKPPQATSSWSLRTVSILFVALSPSSKSSPPRLVGWGCRDRLRRWACVQFAIGEPKGKRNLIESAQAFSMHTDCP